MTSDGSRCFGDGDPLYAAYHDDEWGRPVTTEQGLFEKICLEGFQTGLSWRLILGRRESLRAAFAGFDPDVLVGWGEPELAVALDFPGVIRSAAKVKMVVTNARATVALRDEPGGLTAAVWAHAPAQDTTPASWGDVPAVTNFSTELAKTLRRKGFKYIGPTTAYALMQADGLVNDHLAGCPVRDAVEAERHAARAQLDVPG
jgi:DNA-3-methyladenine glycosylase I